MHNKLDSDLEDFISQDSSPFFNFTHNTDGVITFVDENVTELLGFSTENFQNDYTRHLTANPMNRDVIKYTTRSMSGQQQEPYQVEIYDTNYNVHILNVFGKPIIENKKVVEIRGIAKLLN